jgi:hypothetical protein
MARRRRAGLLALVLVVVAAGRASAQVFVAGAAAAGMGDAYGAIARGARAPLWNPANLGLPKNPGFSLFLPEATVEYGSAPIPLSEIKDYGGKVIPDSVKLDWLNRIGPEGSFTGRVTGQIAPVGISVSHFALTTAVQAYQLADLPQDAAELILFGSGGPSGGNLAFTNGGFAGYAVSAVMGSAGLPLPWHFLGGKTAVGLTAKYVMGNGDVAAKDGQAVLRDNPFADTVRFPVILLYDKNSIIQKTGFGLDLGFAMSANKLALGLTVYDLVNTLKFDPTKGRATTGEAFVNEDSAFSSFEDVPLDSASAQVKQAAQTIADQARFKPTARVSAAYTLSAQLLIAGDLLYNFGDARSLRIGSKASGGAGVEFRPLHFLPLRGGLRANDDGVGWTLGAGLESSAAQINGAYGMRNGRQTIALGVSFGGGR